MRTNGAHEEIREPLRRAFESIAVAAEARAAILVGDSSQSMHAKAKWESMHAISKAIADLFRNMPDQQEELRAAVRDACMAYAREFAMERTTSLDDRERRLDRRERELEEGWTELRRRLAADPVQARMDAFIEKIDDIIPIESGKYGNYAQAIRSRGLVLAALAGMRNVGGRIPEQDAEPAEDAPRRTIAPSRLQAVREPDDDLPV